MFYGLMVSAVRFAAKSVTPEELHPAIDALALGARIGGMLKSKLDEGAEGDGDDPDDTFLDLPGFDL